MFKTSTLTEGNKSKSKPTQVRFADLFFNVAFHFYLFQVLLIVSSDLSFPPSKTVKHLAYDSPLEKNYVEENIIPKCHSGSRWEAIQQSKMWIDLLTSICKPTIKHVKKYQEKLKEFDLLFGDSPPDCHVIIAEFLALPRIDIKPAFVMRAKHELSLVSYIPSLTSSNSDKMSFMERLQNLFFIGVMKASEIYACTLFGELKTEFKIMPERHFQVSIHMAEMTLIMGHFALEYPQPLLPGITTHN